MRMKQSSLIFIIISLLLMIRISLVRVFGAFLYQTSLCITVYSCQHNVKELWCQNTTQCFTPMDPLALLRQHMSKDLKYNVYDKYIDFGGVKCPKEIPTRFRIYGTDREGETRSYYTLGSIVFLLENLKKTHLEYVKLAGSLKYQPICRPDRLELLGYLNGEISQSDSIDKVCENVKWEPIEIETNNVPSSENAKPVITNTPIKQEKVPQLPLKMEAKLNNITTVPNIRPLSDKLPKEVIQQLRAKAAAIRRSRIVEADDQDNASLSIDINQDALVVEAINTERVWRDRNSILRCVNKDFLTSVDSILNSIKAFEEGKTKPEVITKDTSKTQHTGYSRYDQEKFGSRDETDDFEIDIHGTYHGMSLKSVTEGAIVKKPSVIQPVRNSNAEKPKRASRTPIIIIPAGIVSTITMLNVRDILQDFNYVSNEAKRQSGVKRESEALIQRQKSDGSIVPYRVVDSISKLTADDWNDRVVAVFCQGPAWQFKNWPWNGNPIEIFQKAFHVHLSGSKMNENISHWNVNVIELDVHKRHLDRARLMTFWDKLERITNPICDNDDCKKLICICF